MQKRETQHTIVIGAGMAGLAAARVLAEAGQPVLVLEAGRRVGGRIHTVHAHDGQPIELGAEFVHGRPPELWALIAEAGLETYERVGSFLVSVDGQLRGEDWQPGGSAEHSSGNAPAEPLK